MAVLVEAISVIIRCTAIRDRFPGSWPAFRDAAPNQTLCCDNELARIGFMTFDDANRYVENLAAHGILYLVDGKPRDLVLADQRLGLSAACQWAEFGHIDWQGDPGKKVAACQATGTECHRLYTPEGWTYERSLSHQFDFVEQGRVQERLQYVRHQNGVDVYRDLETGREVYVGRASSAGGEDPRGRMPEG